MEKNTIKYILDVGLGISFLTVVLTGIFKFSGFREFLGINLSYNQAPMPLISWFHDWSGVVMAVIVLFHLMLNWDWIVSMTKGFFKKDADKIKSQKESALKNTKNIENKNQLSFNKNKKLKPM